MLLRSEGRVNLIAVEIQFSCVVECSDVFEVPYFLKYSRSKIFAVEHNLCISEIILTSKFRG